ncbi:hypothetical protein AB0903_33760 [Streptomyces sp. NPDC048389]|uniref:hypothetical protein n=1 Tax=Streptomyces sp. NPDC048389 TaxID=3154622 RepID=UPI0034548D11
MFRTRVTAAGAAHAVAVAVPVLTAQSTTVDGTSAISSTGSMAWQAGPARGAEGADSAENSASTATTTTDLPEGTAGLQRHVA